MNKLHMKILILFVLCAFFAETKKHKHTHECTHDQLMKDYEPIISPHRHTPEHHESSTERRNLALANPQPIRITTDTSFLSTLPSNYSGIKAYIEK